MPAYTRVVKRVTGPFVKAIGFENFAIALGVKHQFAISWRPLGHHVEWNCKFRLKCCLLVYESSRIKVEALLHLPAAGTQITQIMHVIN